MKDHWKVAAYVLLIGLLGTDIGLQISIRFGNPAVVTPQQPVQPKGGQKSQSAPDYDHPLITGVLTLLVIGYQTFIFRGQRYIMDRQADIAEQAMTISKQPRVFISGVIFYSWTDRIVYGSDVDQPRADPSANYCLEVVGDTPATTRFLHHRLVFEKKLPAEPSYDGVRSTSHHVLKASEGPYPQEVPFLATMTREMKLKVRGYDGKGGFLPAPEMFHWFLVGQVVYDDVFGNQHELGFCYGASAEGGQGYIRGGDAYNYHRTIKAAARA